MAPLPEYLLDSAGPIARRAVPGVRERGSPASFHAASGIAAPTETIADDMPYGTACHA